MIESVSYHEWLYVRVYLRHDVSIDVEKLTHALHRDVCTERAIDELEVAALLGCIIRLQLTVLVFLDKVCGREERWIRAAGKDSRPDNNIWRRQIIE